jgi:hypothetical protein
VADARATHVEALPPLPHVPVESVPVTGHAERASVASVTEYVVGTPGVPIAPQSKKL